MDENKKSVFYFAFDELNQKSAFEQLLKISGVGPKTAFLISQMPRAELNNAIDKLDSKYFQSIPGVGPKLAKKIILELKGTFKLEEVGSIDIKQKNFKNIVKTLKNLGYESEKVKTILTTYQGDLETDDLASVIKRVIAQI